MKKMIYSDSLDIMVYSGFTLGKNHYTWHDLDCVYYNDDCEEDFYMEIPHDAIRD